MTLRRISDSHKNKLQFSRVMHDFPLEDSQLITFISSARSTEVCAVVRNEGD